MTYLPTLVMISGHGASSSSEDSDVSCDFDVDDCSFQLGDFQRTRFSLSGLESRGRELTVLQLFAALSPEGRPGISDVSALVWNLRAASLIPLF